MSAYIYLKHYNGMCTSSDRIWTTPIRGEHYSAKLLTSILLPRNEVDDLIWPFNRLALILEKGFSRLDVLEPYEFRN